jgi:hypothetical protein
MKVWSLPNTDTDYTDYLLRLRVLKLLVEYSLAQNFPSYTNYELIDELHGRQSKCLFLVILLISS